MKKALILMLSLLFLFCFSISVVAHPGSLDSNGGHYNRKTGEYHYHDGKNVDSDSDSGIDWDKVDESIEKEKNQYKNSSASSPQKANQKHKTFSFLVKANSSYEWRVSDIIHLIIVSIVILGFGYFLIFKNFRDWEGLSVEFFSTLAMWLVCSAIVICFSLSFDFLPYYENGFVSQWLLCVFGGAYFGAIALTITGAISWGVFCGLFKAFRFIFKSLFKYLRLFFEDFFDDVRFLSSFSNAPIFIGLFIIALIILTVLVYKFVSSYL